jgi:hypothetical protein
MTDIDSNVFILGAGIHPRKIPGSLLNRGHHVLGFVSSRPATDGLDDLPANGLSLIGDNQFPSATQLICAIFNRYDPCAELVALAYFYGFDRILMPWDFYLYLEEDLGWCYWLSPETVKPLERTEACIPYQRVHTLLADEESNDTFRRFHAFRQGPDVAFSKAMASEPRYFNELTLAPFAERPLITYLDVGAYDGNPLLILLASKTVDTARLFEPDTANNAALRGNLKDLNRLHPAVKIKALPLALGNADPCGPRRRPLPFRNSRFHQDRFRISRSRAGPRHGWPDPPLFTRTGGLPVPPDQGHHRSADRHLCPPRRTALLLLSSPPYVQLIRIRALCCAMLMKVSDFILQPLLRLGISHCSAITSGSDLNSLYLISDSYIILGLRGVA